MKTRIYRALWIFGLSLPVWLAGCSATQPAPACFIARGTWQGKYTLKAPMPPPTGLCIVPDGETFNIDKYAGNSQTPYGDPHPRVAIKPASLTPSPPGTYDQGNYAPTRAPCNAACVANTPIVDTAHPNNSIGQLTADQPDANNLCTVPSMSTDAEQDVEGKFAKYAWTNVRFFVTAAHVGTQMAASLTVTTGPAGGASDCTANYDVIGLAPQVGCRTDADCALPANGIDPGYPVVCDRALGACMFTGAFPSVKPGQ